MEGTVDDFFPSKYLRASDVKGPQVVTIDRVEAEDFGGEKKPVVYFKEINKGVVLNKTNSLSICKITGVKEWSKFAGKKVRMVNAEVTLKGDLVEAIRFKPVE